MTRRPDFIERTEVRCARGHRTFDVYEILDATYPYSLTQDAPIERVKIVHKCHGCASSNRQTRDAGRGLTGWEIPLAHIPGPQLQTLECPRCASLGRRRQKIAVDYKCRLAIAYCVKCNATALYRFPPPPVAAIGAGVRPTRAPETGATVAERRRRSAG